MAARKTGISLFTGAGGLDLGFEAAGFDTKAAVEMDPDAVATLNHNRNHNRSWRVIPKDIHAVTSSELLEKAGLKEGEADILIGGPPCQPFSKSGFWANGDTKRLDDPRSGTLGAYLRVLRDTLPKSFLIENVPGLAFQGKDEGLDLIERTVEAINRERKVSYDIRVAKLNAAHYGIPQLRERVFVIASRKGIPFAFPKATHGDGLKPFATAWDAIGDLIRNDDPALRVRGKWAELLPSIPEGQNYLWHTERGGGLALFGWRRRYWSFLLKLAKGLPSWTLQAQPGPAIGPFHWESRRLSMRELCRLQTIPDRFEVLGDVATVQKQVGNAVPSALAEVLGRAIRKQFFGDSVKMAPTLIPVPRLPVPPKTRTRKVPDEYLDLVGDHEPHPGTGKGHKASRRVG